MASVVSTIRALLGPPRTLLYYRREILSNYRPRKNTARLGTALYSEKSSVNTPTQLYEALVRDKRLEDNPEQRRILSLLDELAESLPDHQAQMLTYWTKLDDWQTQRESYIEAERRRRDDLEREWKLERSRLRRNPVLRLYTWVKSSYGKEENDGMSPEGKVRGPKPEYMPDTYYQQKGLSRRPVAPSPPKGLYLFGGVGVGKSMLMDLLFKATQSTLDNRRRVFTEMHVYHQELSETIENLRGSRDSGDCGKNTVKTRRRINAEVKSKLRAWHPLKYVAERLVGGRRLLFFSFDEFQLNDVATTTILRGLFQRLFDMGVVVVATGNRTPGDFQRFFHSQEDFEAFLGLWKDWCQFEELSSGTDYRYRQNTLPLDQSPSASTAPIDLTELPEGFPYFIGEDSDTSLRVSKAIVLILKAQAESGVKGPLLPGALQDSNIIGGYGRNLSVKRCGGVAVYEFEDLCASALGPADFIAISEQFHTVVIQGVKQMSIATRDQARRFISLVDEVYNRGSRLILTSEVPIQKLFDGDVDIDAQTARTLELEKELQFDRMPMRADEPESIGNAKAIEFDSLKISATHTLFTGEDEKFAFTRAISRLTEMASPMYLTRRSLNPDPEERLPLSAVAH
ncbi:hypothetical protein AAMO2058_001747800 [Amorphochlora amoebiformis]